jgi:DNA polymerase-3 subunit alpha
MQMLLHAAGRGNSTIDQQAASWEYDIKLTYPTSDTELLKRLMATGLTGRQAAQAMQSTMEIADRCNVILPRSEQIRFPLPTGVTIKEYIWEELRKGWRFRYAENANIRANESQYSDRIRYEMTPLEAKDFLDYFAMLSEAVIWSKNQGIPVGPGRGSAAASLVCYMLRITEVDPLQFPHMIFERFIDANRTDLPDVDLDFDDGRRHETREHMADIYGADHVGSIANFVRYKGRNSINDVARVYGLPYDDMEVLKGLVIGRSIGDTREDSGLADTIDMFPQAKEIFDRNPDLQNAIDLEGNYRGMNVHAAGLVISNAPITDTSAIYTREVGKHKQVVSVIAYNKYDAEYLGMLKADFLGLSTMGMIGIALGIIGMKLEDLYRVPLTEPKTLKAFKDNDVIGIFQFEGHTTRLINQDVQPDDFGELCDVIALSRPGPLFSGTTSNYVAVKHGRQEPLHLHPLLDEATKESKFQIVYQEQVLIAIKDIGGFPVKKVGDIRKIISQKLGEASFNNMLGEFISGAKRLHDMPEDKARQIWKFLVTSATYSFNISHTVSYTMISFWCMWLKQHHPLAFYTAQLQKVGDDKKAAETKRARLLKDALRHGISILPPDPNLSGRTWTANSNSNAILGGFEQIPGIGEKTGEAMLEWRDSVKWGQVVRWSDFTVIKGIGPKTMDKIAEFCTQEDPFEVNRLGKVMESMRRQIKSGSLRVWLPTHTSDDIPSDADGLNVVWMGIPREREYKDAVEDERARSGNDVEKIMAEMKDRHLLKSCVLKCEDDGDEEVYLRFSRWAFPKYQNALESLRVGHDVVLVKGLKRKGFGVSLAVKDMIVIDPED